MKDQLIILKGSEQRRHRLLGTDIHFLDHPVCWFDKLPQDMKLCMRAIQICTLQRFGRKQKPYVLKC